MRKRLKHPTIWTIALGLAIWLASPAGAQAPALVTSWPAEFRPLGLALDGRGGLFMVDEIDFRVYTLTGYFLWQVVGFEGYGIAFLSDGTFYVADWYGTRLVHYQTNAAVLGSFPTGGTRALFLAVDGANNVYVTDDEGDAVREFATDGTLLAHWTAPHPSGVALAGGEVFVAGMFDGLMHVFTPSGAPIRAFSTGCVWSEQLTVDPSGQLLYLTDHTAHQLKCFDLAGNLQWAIGPNLGIAQFEDVDFFSVAVTPSGTIFAGDYSGRRILVLGNAATPTTHRTWGDLKAKYR